MTTEEREKIYAEKTTKYFGDIVFCVPIAGFADELFDMIDARDAKLEKIASLVAEGKRALLSTNGNPPVKKEFVADWFDRFEATLNSVEA